MNIKFLVALCAVAAVAQAINVDWTKVKTIDILPKKTPGILGKSSRGQKLLESRITGGENPVSLPFQAPDIDWSTVYTPEVFPENLAGFVDEAIRDKDSELGSRIVGGEEATPGQFPYQVGLFYGTAAGTAFCGGSILNEEWVLTAAHCVDGATSVEVVAAAHYITEQEEGQLRITASEIIINENWNPRALTGDVALLRLSEPLSFSDRIQPIRLPSRSQINKNWSRSTGTVSGWGRPSDSVQALSPVLRWVSNSITTQLACNIRYFGAINNDQICLDGSGGRSSCNGDSGGPLVVTDTDGEATQLGVVSFGIALGCEVGWPGVYSRVSSYLNWIETSTRGSVVIRD